MEIHSKYPRRFRSKWFDTGSRTIDHGQGFHIWIDDDGCHVYRIRGPWSVDDLFGEMGYWPANMKWHESSERLADLLHKLAKVTKVNESILRRVIFEHEADMKQYLNEEEASDSKDLQGLWKKWHDFHGSHHIPGIPSPEEWRSDWADFDGYKITPKDFRYNGLDLKYDKKGWDAQLWNQGDDFEELFLPDMWHANTFEELFTAIDEYGLELCSCIPWTRNELVRLLIADDPSWRTFLLHN